MAAIPEAFHDLFEKRTFAHVATLMGDDTPQVTPVWVDYDSDRDRLLLNTVRGRLKERNLQRNPKVGVSMTDPEDPYRFLSVRGEVDAMVEDGAVDHIDELARRYMDVDEYPNKGTEEGARVIVEIRPDRVATS
ncbi:PPOX class F420-dependent oxidoreductase [Halobacteria archaeon HArc-gm2]|nr:PPOX class F420-dependent oxidoreductase [Halobacteria archaeon HArc-gm2]